MPLEAWLRFDDADDVDAETWAAVARARDALRGRQREREGVQGSETA
jgi:hypothetical protein